MDLYKAGRVVTFYPGKIALDFKSNNIDILIFLHKLLTF